MPDNVESEVVATAPNETMQPHQEKYEALTRKRLCYQSRIKAALDEIEKSPTENRSLAIFERKAQNVQKDIAKIDSINDEILDLFVECKLAQTNPTMSYETLHQAKYVSTISDRLSELKGAYDTEDEGADGASSEFKRPTLNCTYFTGITKDKFEFHNFLVQFNSSIAEIGNLSKTAKFRYLKNYMKEDALALIKHLPLAKGSYDEALGLLKQEYLDVPFIMESSVRSILWEKPKSDDFLHIKKYLNRIRTLIFELKMYNMDFMDDHPGRFVFSVVVFDNLPNSFRNELINRVGNNYPTLKEVMDNFPEIIKKLIRTNNHPSNLSRREIDEKPTPPKHHQKRAPQPRSGTLQNFQTAATTMPEQFSETKLLCKFCESTQHTNRYCEQFSTLEARRKRCIALNICTLCTSTRHNKDKCPGNQGQLKFPCKLCNSRSHASALCDKSDKVDMA